MKRLFTFLPSIFVLSLVIAQSPQKFSFQTVIRNSNNVLVANQQIGLRVSILQGSENGVIAYSERHNPLTNANGLASVQIGGGQILGGNFQNIDWANGLYFVKTDTDINGGTNYSISATQQLLSVPYSLYSNDVYSKVSAVGDTLYIGNNYYIVPGISAANQQVVLLPTDHTCGEPNVHNGNKVYGNVTDQQGNTYKTIQIGGQNWMAENLKTSIYRNGETIANLNSLQWSSTTSGAWEYYDNNIDFECPYGKLYNWYAATDSRNVCPTGWHVPTISEWLILEATLGGDMLAGGKMKSTGSDHWSSPNESASNESGFSVLPCGAVSSSSTSLFLNESAYFWSASPVNVAVASGYFLSYYAGQSYQIESPRNEGYAIRCIQD
jgi:uncharacterized protein (TIGR02145 family)